MTPTTKLRQAIRPNETILLSDFLRAANLGRAAWRTVHDRCEELGIRIVTYAANKAYIHTDGWLEYLSRVGESTRRQVERRETR